ncbi:MFS general substrate transporter [Lentinula guzmanii]|uniref:MFS general substrate transporter n=1 Tax=Lentinula guzmanii TaxID=2804957 RepID=A0AA38MY18_9AGAR|nr:MFS general substrate transporter [Lentinula guzmanii]
MASFASSAPTADKSIERVDCKTSHADESALDDADASNISEIAIPKHLSASIVVASGTHTDTRRLSSVGQDSNYPFDLRPFSASYLSERTRRPSVIRADSGAETIATLASSLNDSSLAPPTRTQTYDSTTAILSRARALQYEESPTINNQIARKQNRRSILHFAALCWCFALEGWNDGSVGPLLPVIQAYYSVGFSVVSLLFVSNCCGFLIGAGANVWLNERLGFGKVMILGSLFLLATFVIQSPAPPFPALIISFLFAGFGMSLQGAQANGFVGSLKKNKSSKLMMLHASYGLGAFCSPLVATQFSQARHWSYHYIISAGIAVSNVIILCAVFRFKRQEDLLLEIGQEPSEEAALNTTSTSANLYQQILNIRAVYLMAVFALIYVGVEVTIGGWIVTFIIRERDGGPSAGYISSGFFGGLTLGRLALMYINKKIGEHRVVFIYVLLSIGLEVTVWFVPSIIENAVAVSSLKFPLSMAETDVAQVSFVGVLLGPLWPILVGHGARVIPAYLFTACMGLITGIGMAGSAALPFITGVLASKYGIKSLQPFLVAMMCTMVGLWALVPKARRIA